LQEEDGRRRRRFIAWAPKDHHRPVDENQFIRRRRRDAEVDEHEIRLGIERRGKHGQPAPRIPDMRSIRVAAQIRPVGARRIIEHATAPNDLFTPDSEHRGDSPRISGRGIERQKLLIAFHGVELERGLVSIFNARIAAHRSAAKVGDRHDIRRRRSVSGPFFMTERAADAPPI